MPKSNELREQRSEISFYVAPNTQVSKEPPASHIENIPDEDEDNSTATTVEGHRDEKTTLIQVSRQHIFLANISQAICLDR